MSQHAAHEGLVKTGKKSPRYEASGGKQMAGRPYANRTQPMTDVLRFGQFTFAKT